MTVSHDRTDVGRPRTSRAPAPASSTKPVHQVRYQTLDSIPTLTALCAGYELGRWRTAELVQDVFSRHLPSFALSFTDVNSIDGATAANMLRKAAKAVYATDKYKSRGEFGELLLHSAVKDFFGAVPAVSKIHFKDSPNDTVKGFDCVHIVENHDAVELWVGEVKYYKDLNSAIRDCVQELKDHLATGYLRSEFVAITNKLDPMAPFSSRVADLLDGANSLDQIIDHLVVPVMLTYDSPTVRKHSRVTHEYEEAIREESETAWQKFTNALDIPFPITLHLILVPLHDKDDLTARFQQKLELWQQI